MQKSASPDTWPLPFLGASRSRFSSEETASSVSWQWVSWSVPVSARFGRNGKLRFVAVGFLERHRLDLLRKERQVPFRGSGFSWERGHPARARQGQNFHVPARRAPSRGKSPSAAGFSGSAIASTRFGRNGKLRVGVVAFPGSVGILPAPGPKGRRGSLLHRDDGDIGRKPCGTVAPSRAPPRWPRSQQGQTPLHRAKRAPRG